MTGTTTAPPWSDLREQGLARYMELLAASRSPLLAAGESVLAQIREQFLTVVDDAAADRPEPRGDGRPLSTTIGRDRAATGVHPSESLAAANLIFAAALPVLTTHLESLGIPGAGHEAALRLNAAILRRMAAAAKAYVEYLMEKSGTAHADEARRISRDLHDEVAPAIAVGLQRIDLAAHYLAEDAAKAEDKLASARAALLDAVGLVRALSVETRLAVEPAELPHALAAYLATLGPEIRGTLTEEADHTLMPAHFAREIFLVLREAVRNAANHADPTEVRVDLRITGTSFVGVVRDNGVGIPPGPLAGTAGISSMRERAALLDGELAITSEPGCTEVVLTVPLPRRDLA